MRVAHKRVMSGATEFHRVAAPTHRALGMVRIAQRCGATVPLWLVKKFEGLDDDLETRKLISATVVAEQVEKLRRHGFDSFHFYTLNQAGLVSTVWQRLGL